MTLHISGEMAEAIAIVAQSEDATPSEIIRDAIRRDLHRRANKRKANAERAKALEPLRKLVLQDFERSQSWAQLESRLMDKGYRLLRGPNDLILHRASGERMCRLSEIGIVREQLEARFDAQPTKALAS